MDQAFWMSVRENGYALPEGCDLASLSEELCVLLGDPDPVLRDELAYSTLATWVSEGRYTASALREMGQRMAANLRIGLGEHDTDSVFLRAFSVLILGEIIATDAQHARLPQAVIDAWRAESLHYLGEEADERGFIPGRGWAHAAAHTADCLWAFANHPGTGADALRELLNSIADRVLRHGAQVFIHEEDERLAFACLAAFRRQEISHRDIGRWCARFDTPPSGGTWFNDSREDAGARTYLNVKTFLRSLYLQLLWTDHPPQVRDAALECLLQTLRTIGTGLYSQPT